MKRTDLGFKVVVDNLFWGMVYNNDVFDPIRVGDRLSAYVKHVREDGKIDVTLRGRGGDRVFQLSRRIVGYLKDNGGRMNVTDSSSPEEIKSLFQCSKRILKRPWDCCIKRPGESVGRCRVAGCARDGKMMLCKRNLLAASFILCLICITFV